MMWTDVDLALLLVEGSPRNFEAVEPLTTGTQLPVANKGFSGNAAPEALDLQTRGGGEAPLMNTCLCYLAICTNY